MLQAHDAPAIPAETRRVAQAAFPKGCLAMTLRDAFGMIFSDAQFADLGSLGFCGKGPHIGLPRLRKPAITFQVQIQTLEERGDATNAVAAPLEGLDLVVEALHETAAAPLREVVDNLSQPVG